MLTELELPHVYHTVGRNSPKRIAMREKWDTFQARYFCKRLSSHAKPWCFEQGRLTGAGKAAMLGRSLLWPVDLVMHISITF